MKTSGRSSSEAPIRETAVRWTVRRDRGLSSAESIEYELWLAVDPRHPAAMARAAGAWARLDRLPEVVAQATLAAATRRRSFWRRSLALGSLATAAAVVAVWFRVGPHEAPPVDPPGGALTLQAAGPRVAVLADGTTVRLNAGSEIAEQFTGVERRVRLVRGEAHFLVVKDPARPFVVSAGALCVRAVGTAFNVNLQTAQVEVLVTEGRVEVAASLERAGDKAGNDATTAAGTSLAELEAGERLRVGRGEPGPGRRAPTVERDRVAPAEISRALAWQDDLLRLGGATLAEIAGTFERRTGRRVVLADPALAGLRLGGRFRADDIDGFASLLATTLDIDVERAADGTLLLRKKKAESR
jgi:transmembrane sensor